MKDNITAVVISDSHGNSEGIENLKSLVEENDYVIHLGDGVNDLRSLFLYYYDKIIAVKGNCDSSIFYDKEKIIELGKVKTLITHGDLYGVKYGFDRIVNYAKQKGCKLVLYGHTHLADQREVDGITLLNPGSLQRYGIENSYGYLAIVGEKIIFKINKVKI